MVEGLSRGPERLREIARAVGEGVIAIQLAHEYLAEQPS
jgi:hypothetical protein